MVFVVKWRVLELSRIALMKEADVHRQTLSKAADRATLLVNKVNKLTVFKCEFSEFFKLPTNEVQAASSVASSNSNSRENSRDRSKVFYNYDHLRPKYILPGDCDTKLCKKFIRDFSGWISSSFRSGCDKGF